MKTKYLFYLLVPAILLFGCKKEDFTGMSSVKPTNPTITVTGTSTEALTANDGAETSFTFTLNMDVAQVVDVKVWLSVLEGTATEGEDFSMPSSVIIPAGRTSASFKVTVLADEVPEETENFTIQIGDERTANATFKPVTQKFVINNFEATDLKVSMSWNPEAYNQHGEQIDPYDIADLMMIIYYNDNPIDTVDGAGAESYVLEDTMPDGLYKIVTAFYDAMSFDEPVDIPLTVETYQAGVASSSVTNEYSGILSTADVDMCDFKLYLISIDKQGSTYTIASIPERILPLNLADFDGVYNNSLEGFYYLGTLSGADTLEIVDSLVPTNDSIFVSYLGTYVMKAWWNEEVIDSVPVYINIKSDGTIEIPSQYCMSTIYNGDTSMYYITGTGVWNSCNHTYELHYDLVYPSGFAIAQWSYDNGYFSVPYFIEKVPATAKSVHKAMKVPNKPRY